MHIRMLQLETCPTRIYVYSSNIFKYYFDQSNRWQGGHGPLHFENTQVKMPIFCQFQKRNPTLTLHGIRNFERLIGRLDAGRQNGIIASSIHALITLLRSVCKNDARRRMRGAHKACTHSFCVCDSPSQAQRH